MSRGVRILVVAVALALPALFSVLAPTLMNDYFVRVATVICINALLVVSMGLANGFTGVFSLGHIGFVAAIIGGFGSIAGALLGGYLLGALEIFIVAFLPSEVSPYRDAIVFTLLIAFLLFRPNGLLKRSQEVKL